MYTETNNLSKFIIITFKTFHCSWASTRTICRIFVVYIKLWCITKGWYKGSQSMLQRPSTVTTPVLYNSLCRKRAIRRILQRKVGRSYLPWRIWSRQCIYRTLWSNSTRYILKNTHKMNLKWIYAQKKLNALKSFLLWINLTKEIMRKCILNGKDLIFFYFKLITYFILQILIVRGWKYR